MAGNRVPRPPGLVTSWSDAQASSEEHESLAGGWQPKWHHEQTKTALAEIPSDESLAVHLRAFGVPREPFAISQSSTVVSSTVWPIGSEAGTMMSSYEAASSQASSSTDWPVGADTITIKNIPCRCRGREILAALESLGFTRDMLVYCHLPLKHGKASCNLGYCFVGFTSPQLAEEFCKRAANFRFPSRQSEKVIHVEPSRIQGGAMLGSPLMHGEVIWFDQNQTNPSRTLDRTATQRSTVAVVDRGSHSRETPRVEHGSSSASGSEKYYEPVNVLRFCL